ncbi:MAG: thioesterase family protein [Myxococcaceae bacterium]
MEVPTAFFVPDGDSFRATALTRGPWHNDLQHGGPPCALLARAAERFGDDMERFFLSRLTIDYLRPIPLAKLHVVATPLKLGSKAQRLELKLLHGGTELLRGMALRLRRDTGGAISRRPEAPGAPDGLLDFHFPFFQHELGYHRGIEARYLRGLWGDTNVSVWARLRVPLLEGERTSGLQRAVILADAESGLCPPLDITKFTFVNPDLSLHFDREPEGDWVCLETVSTTSALGVGLSQSALHDRLGLFGRASQALLVERR